MGKLVVGVRHFPLLCALWLALPTIAASQGSVTLQPNQGTMNTKVTATGTGWPPGVLIYAFFNQTPVSVNPVPVKPDGSFSLDFCVPDTQSPGPQPTFFTGIGGGMYSGPIFTITAGSRGTCQQAATCKPAFFIGVRGSGEGPGDDWLGDTIRPFYKKFEALYGKTNVDAYGVPYSAIPVPNFAASRDLNEFSNMLHTFGGSVAEGVTKLHDVLTTQHTTCPNQQFVILGYSQGAWAAGEVLAELEEHDPTLLSHIAAIVLLGDPKLWWRNPNFEGIATKLPSFSGGLPSGGGPRQPRYMPDVTDWNISPSQLGAFQFRSYCMGQDPICNATRLVPQGLLPGFPDSDGTTEWKTWLYFCQTEDSRKPEFCQHFIYDKGSLPDEVATWFKDLLSQSR